MAMFRQICACLLAAVLFLFCSLPVAAGEPRPVRLPDSRQWTLHAEGNGRDYAIFVALPDGEPPEDGWPVIYILDANRMFLTAAETVRAYSQRRDAEARLRAIVVGIGYPPGVEVSRARSFDLTPDLPDSRMQHPTGGAEAFLDVIEHELKPEIERRFPVNRQRQALMGHSLAGMFTVNALTRRPQAFQTWVGMSASFWFGQHDLPRRVSTFAEQHASSGIPVRVLFTVGEYEQQPRPELWTRDPERAARMAEDLAARGQIDHAQHAAAQLQQVPGMQVEFHLIAGEDHGTVIPAAIARGIRFILQP